jgi:putative ABC transport system ATP-binding protein
MSSPRAGDAPAGRARIDSDDEQPASAHTPIEAIGVSRSYRQGDTEVTALAHVDLAVAAGELVALTGPSGSGKSTLLHILGALDRPDGGEVLLEGVPLSERSDAELSLVRRRRLGFVLQFFSLLPTLSALENAAFPMLLDGEDEALERARECLGDVGLAQRADHRPAQLSGGEQQRVAIARALAPRPAVILADEPTGNLDSATGKEILEILRAAADRGQTIVMATHDAAAASYADRIERMADGRLETSGTIALP